MVLGTLELAPLRAYLLSSMQTPVHLTLPGLDSVHPAGPELTPAGVRCQSPGLLWMTSQYKTAETAYKQDCFPKLGAGGNQPGKDRQGLGPGRQQRPDVG